MNTNLSSDLPINDSGNKASLVSKAEAKLLVPTIFMQTAGELKVVENRIRATFTSDASILSEISHYLLSLGGKRIRPLFLTLSARLFGLKPLNSEAVDLAAAIELIHMATLLHDDIIDESPLRRNRESAYQKFGLAKTLLAGDFIFARAFGLCAQLDSFIVSSTEQAVVALTEGEVLEGTLSLEEGHSLADYLNVVEKKTASLFSLSAACGAYLAGASSESVAKVETFGREAGVAFQMIDDILDIVADEDLLGKPSGTDLKQQTPSLPNILWLDSGDPFAVEFFSKKNPSAEDCKKALDSLQGSQVIEQSRLVASQHAAAARVAIESIPDPQVQEPVRKQLLALVDFTLKRCL